MDPEGSTYKSSDSQQWQAISLQDHTDLNLLLWGSTLKIMYTFPIIVIIIKHKYFGSQHCIGLVSKILPQ